MFLYPQEEDEFSALAACLGLYPSVPQPSSVVNSASYLQWPVNASDLVTQWCAEVTTLAQIQAEQSMVCQSQPCLSLSESYIMLRMQMLLMKSPTDAVWL